MIKKEDIQQLLLEKGERIGFCVAGGLAFLLLVLALFLPGKGLFSGSASGHIEELNDQTAKVKDKHKNASPTAAESPGDIANATSEFKLRYADPQEYRAFAMFFRPPTKDTKRHQPTILLPDEVKVSVIKGQFPALQFQYETVGDKQQISSVLVVLDDKHESSDSNQSRSGLDTRQLQQGFGGGGGSGPGSLGQRNMNNQFNNQFRKSTTMHSRFRESKPRTKIDFCPIADIKGKKFAEGVLPARIGVVVASFPYKQQIEEFKRALGLTSAGAVLDEHVRGEKDKKHPEGHWPSFGFDGLEVQRMTLKDDGSEGEWEPLDVEATFKQFLIATNKSLEKEKDDPLYKQILQASHGLVMPVPAQLPEDLKKPTVKSKDRRAPDLVGKLKHIQDSMNKLKDDTNKEFAPPPTLGNTDFSAYDPDGGAGKTASGGGVTQAQPSGDSKFGSFQGNSEWAKKIGEVSKLDHCLVRFVDVTLEAGKTYKYRFKVRMNNPNYSPEPSERKDTYVQYAREKVLTSPNWFETPLVVVPPDQYVYTLNLPEAGPKLNNKMRELEPWRWTFVGAFGYPPTQGPNQAVVQIHRWVDNYYPDVTQPGKQMPVGEWLVAARILVNRGEYVRDTDYKVPVPIKPTDLLEHELGTNPKPQRGLNSHLMTVEFGDETLLVDFEGGEQRYNKTEGSGETAKTELVLAQSPVEVLMMRPDGKMIARNSLTDGSDPEREERSKAFTARIDKLRGRVSKTDVDPLTGKPK
jgi:hypothetical protein